MGHGITNYDKNVFADGRPAWHGLGEVLPDNITPREAVLRTMDWQVGEHSVFRKILDGGITKYVEVPGFKLLRREDHGVVNDAMNFDIVSDSYTVIQNSELPEIIEAVMGETGAYVVTAGTLKVGRRVWILCKCPGSWNISGDAVDQYFLLHNTHDASGVLDLLVTPVRVVCFNTLTLAIDQAESGGSNLRLKHTPGIRERLELVRGILSSTNDNWRAFIDRMSYLATKPVSPDFTSAFVEFLFPAETQRKTRALNARADFMRILASPRGKLTPALRNGDHNTVFGLYNAVTEYVQYARTVRVTGLGDAEPTDRDQNEARMNSVIWGSGAKFRQDAYDLLSDPKIADLYTADMRDAKAAIEEYETALN